jgi:uncharacterized protein YqgV (UPF0045/DUF77 family)
MTRVRDRVPANDFRRLIAAIQAIDEAQIEAGIERIVRAIRKSTTRSEPARKKHP